MIDETVEEIREMQTHSSSVVAVKAARALESLTEREFRSLDDYLRDVERNSTALRQANPSHASLQNTQREIVAALDEEFPDIKAAKARTREAARNVIERVEMAKRRAAEYGAMALDDGMTVLTHDYSSTVLEAIELAGREGAELTVYVTEARPRYLGRKSARTLAAIDRVETHLVVDSACGHFLPECDRVLMGMDCIVGETLYNRIGSLPIAATAAETDTPVTVVGSGAKIIDDGFVFENEFRSSSEVMREPAEGFWIENPAYDATPLSLVDSVITDEGMR
ncbi:translation initiation factor eIF-2B [Halococcus thailandensis]|uniref:Initiation factor 2B-like protein n=1 Tax=Halococcus thailandensis JCM 13552 TaxID=1227457 RepID=M0MWG4_9EURY|nr:translation initiation factor eIF-2B [Halococcus thailandensis]EMA49653.1 initiation factor 2B-like protein [Halococcus thailandensis JCM 13552]